MHPTRNSRYLTWIRTLPCLICGRNTGIEAAHTGPHGIAQKSSDRSALPLCARHHRTGADSYHKLGPRAFERHHRVELRAVVANLNEKPLIRIESGLYVSRYRGEEYVLGLLSVGLQAAVHKALAIKREDLTWQMREPHTADYLRIRQRLHPG
jgi:hypothetical protein